MAAIGFTMSKDTVAWIRPLSFIVLGAVVISIGAIIFGGLGALSPVISIVILIASAALILVDFNYIRKHATEDDVIWLATGIFVSIINIFISMLSLIATSRRRHRDARRTTLIGRASSSSRRCRAGFRRRCRGSRARAGSPRCRRGGPAAGSAPVADRDPADRDRRARRQHRVDLHHAVDPDLGARADAAPGNSAAPVAMKQPASIVVPLTCACGPIEHVVAERRRVLLAPAHQRVLHHHAARADRRSRPSSAVSTAPNRIRASGPIADVAADDRGRRHVSARVDRRRPCRGARAASDRRGGHDDVVAVVAERASNGPPQVTSTSFGEPERV